MRTDDRGLAVEKLHRAALDTASHLTGQMSHTPVQGDVAPSRFSCRVRVPRIMWPERVHLARCAEYRVAPDVDDGNIVAGAVESTRDHAACESATVKDSTQIEYKAVYRTN